MHTIQCECGKFQAELTQFPKNSPGRLLCYCDDCQTYMHSLKREDLLDASGGTEVVPVYPADFKIRQGQDMLKCTRLSPNGMFRWSTTCCNTPICNTAPGRAWAGIVHRAYNVKDPGYLERTVGPVKSGIMGRFARGPVAKNVAQTFDLRGMVTVMPFILKGKLLGKSKPSPFFDGQTPIVQPKVLTKDERDSLRAEITQAARGK